MSMSHVIFAAGCFWGVQSVFDAVQGVVSTTVGYTGGRIDNPSYEQVCTGLTGHAEAVLVNFDEKIVSFDKLLDVFFANHNPTEVNRQGVDVGEQYRSAIFVANDEQEALAIEKIRKLNEAKVYKKPIATHVVRENMFYPAEGYHQKYLEKKGQKPSQSFPYNMNINEKKWEDSLSDEQYRVLRKKETERPFSGTLLYVKDDGVYSCGACGNPVFVSDDKFDSGTGWPSFDNAIAGSVILNDDYSHGIYRVEVCCSICESHLGHLFNDGPTNTGLRFCINSNALNFTQQDF